MSISKKPQKVAIIVLVVALVALFETFNARFDNYFYTYPESLRENERFEGLRVKIKNRITQDPRNDFSILILGDCYPLSGFIPAVIEKRTGRTCFNFATHTIYSVLSSFIFLKNYLRTCAKKPDFIVVSFIAETYTRDKDWALSFRSHFYDFAEGNALIFKEEFGVVESAKFYIPSLKHAQFFKDFIRKPGSQIKIPTREQLDAFEKRVYLNKGYYPYHGDWVYRGKRIDTQKYSEVSAFFYQNMQRILDLAKANKIKVVYVVPSMPPNHYLASIRKKNVERAEEYIKRLKKDYPDLIVIYPQPELDRQELYVDFIHTNKEGARLLSELLSREINRLGAPRSISSESQL